jgi:nucleoside-diphosphate-sugar epimerase
MTAYSQLLDALPNSPKTWLITAVASFIGCNLLEHLLKLNQRIVGLDNFTTGHQYNLDEVQQLVSPAQWACFTFIEGDIRILNDCHKACTSLDYVLHQAALGSVPRSIEDPITTNATNISGFLNMLVAAHDAEVKSFTYAASSTTYGDHTTLNDLYRVLQAFLAESGKHYENTPVYRDFHAGDVRHSKADIGKASGKLGYTLEYSIMDGITKAMPWYIENVG